ARVRSRDPDLHLRALRVDRLRHRPQREADDHALSRGRSSRRRGCRGEPGRDTGPGRGAGRPRPRRQGPAGLAERQQPVCRHVPDSGRLLQRTAHRRPEVHHRECQLPVLGPSTGATGARPRPRHAKHALVHGSGGGAAVMKTWMWRRLSERRQDERGAILILSALFLVVMVLAAALALDIGLEGVDKRSDHRVADLAALDAARALNDTVLPCVDATRFATATLAANQSALRNGFNPLASGNSLSLDVGTWNPATKIYT